MPGSLRSDVRFVAPFIRPHLRLILGAILSMAVLAATTSAFAYLVGPALKVVLTSLEPGSGGGVALSLLDAASRGLGLHPIVTLVLVIAVLAVVRSAAQLGESLLIARAGQAIQMDIRDAMFERVTAMRPLAMLKVQKGDLVSKLVGDVTMMEIAITHAVASIIRDALQIIFLAALALSMNAALTLLAMGVIPAGAAVVYVLSGRIRRAFRSAMNLRGRIASMFVETARGLPVIKIFNAEKEQTASLRTANRELQDAMMKALVLAASPAPILELLSAAALGGLLLYVVLASGADLHEPERLISFLAALFLLFRPIKSLGSVTSFLQQGLAATRRIAALFEIERDEGGGTREVPALKEGLRLESVDYAYGDRAILSGLTLSIPAGKITAIVGASGEGKTTAVHLLCGFLAPGGGTVRWDGIDYAELSGRGLRRRISLVSQDPFLMNASIEDNILLGRNRQRRAELRRAVEAAGLDRLISRLKDGMGTNVEEEASSLSTGERQRICIARAILSDADLVIFDEAASSLDSQSEDTIHASLREVGASRTIIVVSHRLSTVRVADRIAVLEGGRIVEEGVYGELARPGTAFHALFSSQILKYSAGQVPPSS